MAPGYALADPVDGSPRVLDLLLAGLGLGVFALMAAYVAACARI